MKKIISLAIITILCVLMCVSAVNGSAKTYINEYGVQYKGGIILPEDEFSAPNVSTPDSSEPDVSIPDNSAPEISNPEISNPETSNPETSNPETSNPETSNPDVSDEPTTSEPQNESSDSETTLPEEESSEPDNEEKGVVGDVNENGKIDMTDYILLKRAYFGTYKI